MGVRYSGSGRCGSYRGPDESPRISYDTLFALLSDSRRRTILQVLAAESGETVDVDELIESIQTRSATATLDDRESILLECHHTHFPKLVDAEVIDYDSQSETVRYHRHPHLEELLELLYQWTT